MIHAATRVAELWLDTWRLDPWSNHERRDSLVSFLIHDRIAVARACANLAEAGSLARSSDEYDQGAASESKKIASAILALAARLEAGEGVDDAE